MDIPFENCKIYFDGDVRKYHGGDTVSGRIELQFEETIGINGKFLIVRFRYFCLH